jgi:UDP-N-acetylmuramoyl-L-alanyl-D-glutamate--2,6-diaminopimelate ligase
MALTWNEILAELRRADLLVSAPETGPAPRAIGTDSRAVASGTMYVAVRGSQVDGHRFVADSVRQGAAAVVVEEPQDSGVPELVVRDGRRAALVLGRAWFGHPARKLALIGVTGTNGKTTTVGLIRHLLNADHGAGSIGTLGAFDGRGEAVPSTAGSLTTPGPVDLQATLAALVQRGVARVAMEASSHSLDQGRLDGLGFAAAVYTNLTRDHLDYPGTMEQYLAAKLRLSTLLANDGIEVINADDPAWRTIPRGPRRVSFGVAAEADLRASALAMDAGGSRFCLSGAFGTADVRLPLLGDFNVANALAAAATALALETPLEEIVARLAGAPQVPGRMERLTEHPCVVLRDYAHTPDALARALATLRPLTPGRVIAVFGCGGDRDRGKRPLMGEVAARHADLVIVTSDNPRSEDPEAILDDIEAGMAGAPHRRIVDRLAAIHAALEEGRPGDTVLLAGKGHETYQILGTGRIAFDERAIVLKAVKGDV